MNCIVKYCILAAMAATAAAGCSAEKSLGPDIPHRAVELSAYRSHIITRSGDQTTVFDAGTAYALFIRDNSGWLVQAHGDDAAVETADHKIDYGASITFGDSPIDFYGATYGTAAAPEIVSPDGTPAVRESLDDDGFLPDLMFSRNLTGRTFDGGTTLEMDFCHAFSKLNIQVVKQDESEDEIKQLTDAKIKKIEITGTHGSGTFGFMYGNWTYSDATDAVVNRPYYSDDAGLVLTTTPVPLSPGTDPATGKEREFYIFPNSDGAQVSVTVTVSGVRDEYGQLLEDVERTYEIRRLNDNTGEDLGVFEFEPNHEYTLLVTVLKDDVRTIAIAPLKYEWIDHDIDMGDLSHGADAFMGQPVTFANQMWMDRNLGASSADCENDWWNCRGYYYQYGRNLPFILDMDKYDLALTSEPEGGLRLMAFYTYNENGQRVYGGFEAKSTTRLPTTPVPEGCAATPAGIPVMYPNVAMNPGESGLNGQTLIYNFVYDIGNGGTWLYNENGIGEAANVNQMWTGSVENHPCPKGWRLPTREDFATFVPDKAFSAPWDRTFHKPQSYNGSITGKPEYLCYGSIGGESAIYVIKNFGREDCYRIKITMKETNSPDYGEHSSDGKYYYECSYYSGDETMTFAGLDTEEKFLNSGLDWSLPSATMQIPACGFIYPGGGLYLCGDGINAILRTTDYVGASTNWVCYLRNDGWTFGMQSSSRKALGDQIRCIRDVTAF